MVRDTMRKKFSGKKTEYVLSQEKKLVESFAPVGHHLSERRLKSRKRRQL